ncbi:MAG: T9SS type A sorting domain-containing protein [Flavobacteriales bacterium]|nr:T9SS type A sorting domain-containing protein [Flavobacteriales bacterium]
MKTRTILTLLSAFAGLLVRGQCSADFSHVSNWDTLAFTNLSSVSNARYYWNFGDGSTSYEADPEHVFIEAGTFQVTLHALDTLSLCHSYHQTWISVSRPPDSSCEPYMTDSQFTYNNTDYVEIFDQATGCTGMMRHIDCMGAQNFSPGNWFNLSSWNNALTMARLRYTSNDSINGLVFRRAYYRTIPYNQTPATSYDTCSADFEYLIDYQPNGAVVTFKPLGSPNADTVWVTGFGNPIPLVGQTSTFTFPYTGGNLGKWQNVWRRNYDPAYGCQSRQAHTLIIRNPYYIAPPTCHIGDQPQDLMVQQNGSAQFIITTDAGSIKQWQQNAGLGWQNLFNAGPYSGVNTDTLTVANCQNWWSNYLYRCVVTAPGSSCHNTSTVAVLSVTVGLEELEQTGISAFPNPVQDNLFLRFSDAGGSARITIIDTLGKEVRNSTQTGSTATIDLSDLSQGLYIIAARTGNRLFQGRIVKQ